MGNVSDIGDIAILGVLMVVTLLALLWWASAAARWHRVGRRRDSWWRHVGRHVRRWQPLPPALAADTLLRHLLSSTEYRQLRRTQYLEVASRGHPGRVYRVPRRGGQVAVVEGGRVVERLCVAPVEHVPLAEVVLVHKLLIEADEEGYLAAANHLAGERERPREEPVVFRLLW